jgi:hypothetical protein
MADFAISVRASSVASSSPERFLEQFGGVIETEFFRPDLQRPVARNLVVLHRLSRRKQPGIERGGTFVFLHDLRAFIGNANDRGTGFSLRLLVDDGEYLFESLNLAFGLAAMLFEGRLQLFIWAAFAILGSVESIFFSAK